MIEEALLNYGILGLWTFTLLIEKYKFNTQMKGVIRENTEMLIKIKEKLK